MHHNRLGSATSPYLLQHRDNPVHWWSWCPEALAAARETGKPILLSVGYAACHWCHVMAHESFEDPATAAVMNAHFVCIKVDREERPDIDAIYMAALHRLGEQGGWPLTMFLDQQARPFWGGTYFPKEARYGRPSFVAVLQEVARIFREDRATVDHNAHVITQMVGRLAAAPPSAFHITDALLADLTARMVKAVDPERGGIAGAPKFPQWSFFWLLWRGAIRYRDDNAAKAVETTLVTMCQGGIYDHLGGGFARYSVDADWLVPHFEKMLYDNALLVDLMTEVYRETRNELLAIRTRETIAWVLREMVADGGAFASSLDADSEGEEGRFYVWTRQEIASALGADADDFCAVYDVTPGGNWEGHNILNRLKEKAILDSETERRLARCRARLLHHRAVRIPPGWDDKVLADWNGLMIAALARSALVFAEPAWLAAAERAFAFITSRMENNGRLAHAYRGEKFVDIATASDYANMSWAALRLHEATGSAIYLDAAIRWTEVLNERYWVADLGGYATTDIDASDVIVRLRPGQDDATPNPNAIMLSVLSHLHQLTADSAFRTRAEQLLTAFSGEIGRNPIGHCGLLANVIDLICPIKVSIAAPEGCDLLSALHAHSLPGSLEFVTPTPHTSAPHDRTAIVCAGETCSAPVTTSTDLENLLKRARAIT